MNYDDLLESLTDFFSRQHHEPSIARIRAESVITIVRAHNFGCILGDRCVHRMPEGDDTLAREASHYTP